LDVGPSRRAALRKLETSHGGFLCFRVLPAGRLNFQNCEFISSRTLEQKGADIQGELFALRDDGYGAQLLDRKALSMCSFLRRLPQSWGTGLYNQKMRG